MIHKQMDHGIHEAQYWCDLLYFIGANVRANQSTIHVLDADEIVTNLFWGYWILITMIREQYNHSNKE